LELESAISIAHEVVKKLSPHCDRIEVAGSIRRIKTFVNDIDLVLITSDRDAVDSVLMQLGKMKMSGLKIARVQMESITLDVYYATPETWATLLLIRTGSKESNIRLASTAKRMGWHLAASGDGLFDGLGRRIAGDTEESIYRALRLPYQQPWERN